MVPKRLKEARMEAGLSQEKLSQLLGVAEGINTRSRFSSYEVGRTEPPFKLVKKIAELLDYPENYFYTEDDDFAKAVLDFHRKRTSPELNPNYDSEVEARRMASKLDDVKKIVAQLNEYLKE
ncbi:TPA: helix-turn-helix transcriptional regulator [Escherichia coli]|nr:helix-turn-helix transcriptional regulator [Escherichia coli]